MGFGARRTYDIEAWLPGQDTYREISSVSTWSNHFATSSRMRCDSWGSNWVYPKNWFGGTHSPGRDLPFAAWVKSREIDWMCCVRQTRS